MGHIFISYSRKDEEYVNRLVDALENEGFEVWIDRELLTGDTWTQVINHKIDTCDAFVVVMTASSKESKWVNREVLYALQEGKKIFPLLLQGKLWMLLQDFNYFKVIDGLIPDRKFFKDIEKTVPRSEAWLKSQREAAEKSRLEAEKLERQKAEKEKKPATVKPKAGGQIAYWVGGFIVLVLGIIFLSSLNNPLPTPQPTPENSQTEAIVTLVQNTVEPSATATPKSTSTSANTLTPTPLPTEITDARGVPMVLIPAGEFYMGSSCAEVGCVYKQGGQIEYTEAYWIDKTEVSNTKYSECVEANVCTPPIEVSLSRISEYYGNVEYDDYPVVNITFDQAQSYCEWLGGRLPTNKEWEKAARGTDGRGFPWGIDFQGFEANSCDIHCSDLNSRNDDFNDGYKYTAPVYSFLEYQSPYETLNMAGNVREIVQEKDVRGGAWNTPARLLWTFSLGFGDTAPSDAIGLRCVKDVP